MKNIALIVLLFLASACDDWPKAVSANFAKEVCSCLFVVGQSESYCTEYHTQVFKVSDLEIDDDEKTVTAVGLGIQSMAYYRGPRFGCQLVE